MNIFFDLDGTLLDSRERIYRLFTDLTKQTVLTFDAYWEQKRQMRSNEWLLEHKLGVDQKGIEQFLVEWFPLIESERYLRLDQLFEPVPSLLQALVKQGHTLYVVTARQSEPLAVQQLQNLGVSQYIEQVFVTAGKKAKHELLQEVHVQPSDLFFGDTGLDVQTAKLIGVTSVAVLTGFRSKEILAGYKPDVIAPSVWEYFADL